MSIYFNLWKHYLEISASLLHLYLYFVTVHHQLLSFDISINLYLHSSQHLFMYLSGQKNNDLSIINLFYLFNSNTKKNSWVIPVLICVRVSEAGERKNPQGSTGCLSVGDNKWVSNSILVISVKKDSTHLMSLLLSGFIQIHWVIRQIVFLTLQFICEQIQRPHSVENVNKQTWILNKGKVTFGLLREKIGVCTVFKQPLVCRVIMQLNEKQKFSHLAINSDFTNEHVWNLIQFYLYSAYIFRHLSHRAGLDHTL